MSVIVAISAAVTTIVYLVSNGYVMWLCRKALREGRNLKASFGISPSVEFNQAVPEQNTIDESGSGSPDRQVIQDKSKQESTLALEADSPPSPLAHTQSATKITKPK